MSNEKQFEQWCQSVMTDDADFCMEYGMYINYRVRLYWQAWQAATRSMEAKCAALAAENASLNKFIDDDCYVYGPHDVEPVDAAVEKPQTPAADAFLAEVRAQGVEMAACALDDVNQFNYANMLDDLAQKIRQEAAQ